MPVSGHQEKELHSSDFMGVPIKKRKFLYNCSSTPTPPTLPHPLPQPQKDLTSTSDTPVKASTSSPPQEENEQNSLLTSVQTTVVPLLDSNEKTVGNTQTQNQFPSQKLPIPQNPTAEKTEMQNQFPSHKLPILQKPTAEIAQSSGTEISPKTVPIDQMQLDPNKTHSQRVPILAKPATGPDSEFSSTSTLVVSNDSAFHKKTDTQLGPGKAHLQTVEEEMGVEKDPFDRDNPKFSENSVNEEPPLESLGPSFPDFSVKDDERIPEEMELDPYSWNLVSTETQNIASPTSHNPEAKTSCTRLETNRTHWDLNTTMDTWEGSMNHSAIFRELGTNEKHNTHSKTTVLCESVGSVGASRKKTPEQRGGNSKLPTLTAPVDPQTKNDILLHLSLSTSSAPQTGVIPTPPCTSSSKADAKCDLSSNQNLSRKMLSLSRNLDLPGSRIVKSEPSDESNRRNFLGVQACPLKLVNDRMVKMEPSVGRLQECPDLSNMGNLKLTTPLSVKSESVCGGNQETCGTSEEKFEKSVIQISSTVFQFEKSDIQTCNTVFPLSMQAVPVPGITNCTIALPSTMHPPPCSTLLGLSNSQEASSQSKVPANFMVGTPSTGEEVRTASAAFASDSVSESICTIGKKSEVADVSNLFSGVGYNVVSTESPKIKSPEKFQPDGISDMAGSDEEKINLFDDMQDECSSNSDDDSDNNHGASVMDSEDKPLGCEDDDYEDGEVREPMVHGAIEVGGGLDKGTECDHGILDKGDIGVSGCATDVNATRLGISKSCNGSGANGDLQLTNEHDSCISGPTCLQETSSGEGLVVGTGKSEPIDTFHKGLLNCNGEEDDLKGCEDLYDGTVSTSQGVAPGDDPGSTVSQQENVKGIIPEETKFSIWSKTESPIAGAEAEAEATKDVNAKGSQSRIINLAQAFSGPSQGRKFSFPGRFFPSRIGRERNDGVRNGEKLHLRGSRDDGTIDGRNKFERQRNQDLPMGNAGSEFMHERGRPDKRFDSPHGEWDSDHNSAPLYSNCLTTYRISGPKNAAAVIVSAGRKPLGDELPNFRHPPSRRRSPGGRGRPVSHGVQIVGRSDKFISPDRCVGRGDPNLMRLRPDKKFMRGLPEDMMDTVFSRSQPQFQQVDDHFVRGERSFSPIQRKGPIHIARIRSRSPSRTRSPGPWSSPRRKSPDGFGRSEMIQRRSPPFYRVKRMRSPHQRSIFPDEVEGRRHGSPPYIPRNDLREMGPSREADHPRPFIPNRSPSGRVLPRGTTRRFDMMERERIETDEYFAGPMHSDRFHEIGSNGGSDGRRICAERRRTFRPAYDGGEVEKFHFHVEGGRQYRFSLDSDAEYRERGNLRDREFERRVKKTGNTPRRTRSDEEHEESYRHGEQGWHGAGFDDSSGKRCRF